MDASHPPSQEPSEHQPCASSYRDSTSASADKTQPSDQNDDEDVSPAAPWRALFAFTTPSHVPLLIAGLVTSAIAGAASPALYLVVGELLTDFIAFGAGTLAKDKFLRSTTKYIVYYVAISAGSWLFHFLEFMIWLAFGELQAKSARDRLFHGLLEKEIAWYDMRKNGIGALLPRIQAQIRELQLATAQPMGSLACLLSTAIVSLVQALVKSWDLTLVTLATLPVIVALAVYVGRGMQINLEKQQDKLTEAQKYSANAFSSIETVKCFNGQPIELEKYKSSIIAAAGCFARVANSAALQMGLVSFLAQCMFVQGFYYGGVLVARGNITAGDVVTTFFSALTAFQSLEGILPQMIVFEKGRTAGSTLRTIMAQIQDTSSAKKHGKLLVPDSCHGNIEFRNVSFAYPARPDQFVIRNISMRIRDGQMTFLIGRSGSGKSTIGQLLMRFYDASKGHVLVDNVLLQELDTDWFRSNVTLVEQTSLLFNDTIQRNVALGRKDYENVTTAEVMEALEFALLQLTVNDMPEGLNTPVGFKGGSLSGGQRQRMALARAKLRDTPVLILDESTSALDHISRTLMMDAIRHWRREKTTIIITHDISQILPSDYIYLLEDGCVVQQGHRKDLEQIEHSPFQGFLSEDQATECPADTMDDETLQKVDDSSQSPFEHLEVVSDDEPGDRVEMDALEIALSLSNWQVAKPTFYSDMLVNGTPTSGANFGAPSKAYGSPWVRFVGSPNLEWPPASPKQLQPVDALDTSAAEWSRPSRPVARRLSETLIEKAGQSAADARLGNTPFTRRKAPIRDSMAIPLIEMGGSHKALESGEAPRLNSLKYIFGTVSSNLDRRGKIFLAIGFWAATAHAAASPAFSYVLTLVLGTYSVPGGDKKKALMYSLIILGIAAANGLHTWLFRFLHEYTSELWVDNIRYEAFEHIMDQNRHFFEQDENSVSALTECLDRNADEMRNLLGRFASLAYVVLIMVLVSLLWAMSAQWKMTLICLALAPAIFVITKIFARVSEAWESKSNNASEVAAAIFTETFTNIKTVRALTLERHFLKRYVEATDKALRVGFQRAIYVGFLYGLSDSAGNFGVAVVYYVGARLAADGANVNDIIMVFTMLIFLIMGVTGILGFIPQVGSSKDTAARLLRLTRLSRDSHEHLGDTRITNVGDIMLDNLTFSYPSRPEHVVLKGVNLRLEPGTTTAIVGSSGSGKSTIANLLLNLYTTPSHPSHDVGEIKFGGRDIKHLSTDCLRSLIVPVSQSPTLFAATVAENIAYGLAQDSPYFNRESIEAAAKQSGIHEFITSLPQGYETLIGDGGMGLSGGQAQRVAIARALVRNPSVLILDEATSALDVESANLVRHTIRDLVANRAHEMTVIIITHRKDMMQMAERIVVMDRGVIAEEGTFDELMAMNGALTNMLSGGQWDMERGESRAQAVRTKRSPTLKSVDWIKSKQQRNFKP